MCLTKCYNIYNCYLPLDVTDARFSIHDGQVTSSHENSGSAYMPWTTAEFREFLSYFVHARTNWRSKLEAQIIYTKKIMLLAEKYDAPEAHNAAKLRLRSAHKLLKGITLKQTSPPPSEESKTAMKEQLSGYFAKAVAEAKKATLARANKRKSKSQTARQKASPVFWPTDFYKYKESVSEKDSHSYLPCDFYKYKESINEKVVPTYLPCDFYKYMESINEKVTPSYLPCDFYKYKELLNQHEKDSFLPADFPLFRETVNKKTYPQYLPCDFYKFKEYFKETEGVSYLPSDFYKLKEYFRETEGTSYLPCDFYKFKDYFKESEVASFLPLDFYKFKEYFKESQDTFYLPCDFYKFKEYFKEPSDISYLPSDFPFFRHLLVEKYHRQYLPTCFPHFKAAQSLQKTYLPGDFPHFFTIWTRTIYPVRRKVSGRKSTRKTKPVSRRSSIIQSPITPSTATGLTLRRPLSPEPLYKEPIRKVPKKVSIASLNRHVKHSVRVLRPLCQP
ncbi:hypothetical protein FT663_01301 [Candidozyma haemuli var. vulneris]|uniref:Uncharacterized protein n=1 Tax=Candidozyma haemuli TaxID=45357 RepID=A0A2V1AWD1_9ASCO|nr:hypothetical protein CXQ85_004978 [[Candida] haemuloni]KAF3992166.1 hypothetical protein FT662_01336 [[Candida] haemuloni var. vulneris]KAF3994611.1 hypothetical protein FT663_01301 [[Candida] haemuloni var. vulneris]PVH22410.1 hypothetical protein CXQ85_004978 [[Candida] haemuloni]